MNEGTGSLVLDFFVGRQDALQLFVATLKDLERKPVLFFCGEGGVGKTWLLRRLQQEAKQHSNTLVAPHIIDLIATRYHRISGVRQEIIQFLGEEHFQGFRDAQADFERERDKPEDQRIDEASIRGLQKRADQQFMDDCCDALDGRTAVLFFDTFERVWHEQVGYWIIHELPEAVPDFLIVVAGRPEPPDACPPESTYVQHVSLEGLPTQDAQTFFKTRAAGGGSEPTLPMGPDSPLPVPPTHAVLTELYNKLNGHPLKLDLAILWLRTGTTTIEEIDRLLKEDRLDQGLLQPLQQLGRIPGVIPDDVPSPPDRPQLEAAAFEIILLMAYLNRRFDQRFLERVYTPSPNLTMDHAKRVMGNLPRMFFVKERPGGSLQLHDEMERLVIKYLWPGRDPSEDYRRELAEDAVEVYDDLIQKSKDDREQEELTAERLGYQLRLDVQGAYVDFARAFDRNLQNREFGLCELFLNELTLYEEKLTLPQKVDLQNRRFELALARRDFDLADGLVQTSKQRVSYYFELHEATWKTNPELAKQHVLEAMKLCEQHGLSADLRAKCQRALGFTCRVLGQWDEAIQWYRRCQETAQSMGKDGAHLYADTQNSEGYVYALMGRYDEAKTLIEQAQHLRERIGQPHEVGRSYSTLGEVNRFSGDYRSANRCYDMALEIFERERDQQWKALVLQQMGENTRRIAEKMRAQGDQERVQKWLERSLENHQKSLALYERYNLERERSVLYRRLGRTLRDLGRFDEAERYVKESYDMAVENEDLREQMECLNVLAIIASLRNDFNGVKRYTQSLLMVKTWLADYRVFRGRAHFLRGKAYASRREWDNALAELAAGLTELGRSPGYGHERLRERIRELTHLIDGLPDESAKEKWCHHFIQVWQKEKLDTQLPELVQMCRRYIESLRFL